MQNDTVQPAQPVSAQPATQPVLAQPAAYQPPRVQDLGAWQAVTLINSVPINPGKLFNSDKDNLW